MDDTIQNGLVILHKKIKFLWLAVLSGMLIIILLSYVLYNFQIIELTPVINPQDADKISLVLIVVLVLAIFFLKRSYLIASKIKEKAARNLNKINREDFTFLALDREEHSLLASSILYVNKIYLIIWFLAELVVLIAFVNFILAPLINTFLIYSFVGLYSLAANYPSLRIYKKLYIYIVS